MKKDLNAALLEGFTEPIRDALWGLIYLTPALAALTESAPFMRLHRIMQLGPVYRVYPGATHTRAGHSIGVYHLARRLLIHLVAEGAGGWLSAEGAASFLCAALLHDLGHFPYTHSLKELPLEEHEALTAKLIAAEPLKSLVAAAGGDPDLCAAIVDTSRGGEGVELGFFRKLLSGTLDPDKLDYLSRDARYCGVPYGTQEVDYILTRLHPHPERGVDIDSRGIPGVEALLFSKYLMYRAVYWHRAVRSATAMVKKALFAGFSAGVIAPEELYNLDDQGLFTLVSERRHPLFPMVDSVRNSRLFLTAAEIPFDSKVHGKLLVLSERPQLEESLAAELSPLFGRALKGASLIIDLPEPISFDTGLFVADENCLFSAGSSAFKSPLVNAFRKSLRIIRIFVEPCYEEEIKKSRKVILQLTQKWLQLYAGSQYEIS